MKKLVSFFASALLAIVLVSCGRVSSSAAPSVSLEEYVGMPIISFLPFC